MSKFFNFVSSFLSYIKINLKLYFSKKKTIFFYFPRKDLTLKDLNYIRNLFKDIENKYTIIYGHKLNSLHLNNFYFLNQNFIKYLMNLNLFISNYICDIFPKKTKKIYIHHALYDTPLTGKKNENKTIDRIKKYDYIFLSSKKIVKSFREVFKIRNKSTEIIATGYPRLDFFFDKVKKRIKKNIIIAPANFLAYPNHTLINDVGKIIELIKKTTKFNIIFRPHPANRNYFLNSFENSPIKNLVLKYSNDQSVKFDYSDDYSRSYAESKLMITDLSATAFTFSFLTFSPVIFYSPNEKSFKKNYQRLNHYKDRKKIGNVVKNINSISLSLKNLLKNEKKYKNSIKTLKKKMGLIELSKEKTIKNIINIVENKN